VSTAPTTATTRLNEKIRRARQDRHRRHHDRDLQECLRDQEVGIAGLVRVAHVLELLGLLLDVLLLGAVALLLLIELGQERLELPPRFRLHGGVALGELGLEAQLLAAVEVLADDLGLVEGPLIGGLLLGEQHLLHRVVAAEGRDGQDHREDGRDQRDPPAEVTDRVLVQLFGIG